MRTILTAVLLATLTTVSQPILAQDAQKWKMASALPTSLPVTGDGAIYFADRVRTVTRGRIDITAYDPGKLVPVPQIFEAVSTGSIDAGWAFSAYWMGQNPAYGFFSFVPFGFGLTHYIAWMHEGGGLELWNELYGRQGVHVLPCMIIPPEASGWFRKEVTSVDDLKGMKVRYPGIAGRALEKLGASVQLIPTGETYVALERGLIDATELAVPSIDYSLGLHKVAKHYYFPGWHQPATFGEFIVSQKRWKALDESDRAALEMACRDNLVRSIALFESTQAEALDKIKQAGVEVHTWKPELLDAFRKATQEVMDEMAAENKDFAKVYESYRSFGEKNRLWRELTSALR